MGRHDVRLWLEPWLQGYRRGFELASFGSSSSSSSSASCSSAQQRGDVRPQLSSPSHTKTILDLGRVPKCVEEHRPFFRALPPVEESHDCSLSSGETRQKTQLRKHGTHRTSRDSAQERKWGGATLSQNSAHVWVPFIYPLIWLCKISVCLLFVDYSKNVCIVENTCSTRPADPRREAPIFCLYILLGEICLYIFILLFYSRFCKLCLLSDCPQCFCFEFL